MIEQPSQSFTFQFPASRVLFGQRTTDVLQTEIEKLNISKALVIVTPQQRDAGNQICEILAQNNAGLCDLAQMHTPTDVTQKALDQLQASGADGLVSIGGGSTIGLAKALSIRTGLPHLAIPTTYAGSEMTPILGETADGKKTTRRDPKILPDTVIYDVAHTLTLPVSMSVTSGLNAMAHAVEALYAKDRNPIISLMAERAISQLCFGLRALAQSFTDQGPQSAEPDTFARAQCMEGAWLAGACLGMSSMAIHHKLCHTLGGTFDLPHAETHAVILPYAVQYIGDAAPSAMAAICRALDAEEASHGLRTLAEDLGAPTSLAQIGMPEDGLEHAADIAMQNPYWNPRPLDRSAILDLLTRAHQGRFGAA